MGDCIDIKTGQPYTPPKELPIDAAETVLRMLDYISRIGLTDCIIVGSDKLDQYHFYMTDGLLRSEVMDMLKLAEIDLYSEELGISELSPTYDDYGEGEE